MALLCFFSVLMMEEIEISQLSTSLEPGGGGGVL